MLRTLFCTAVAATTIVAGGSAQTAHGNAVNGCNHDNDSNRASYCETREDTIGGANPIDVDASPNGGIRVRGWDRGDVLVRATINASADTDADARRIAGAVRVDTSGGRVRADGPQLSEHEHWNVTFDLQVPRTAILTLNTKNGGISIADFRGAAEFHTVNGGLTLTGVSGDLKGSTTNGGITVDLSGNHWDGAGLDLETHNGGIKLTMPKGYSAELETATAHGRINSDFPITVAGEIGRQLTTTLGSGGPKLRAITTNGGVTVRER
jgi:DUF4097 and DUF4098 domain-containing protein YvlB